MAADADARAGEEARGLFEGLRVLDLGEGVAAPFAARLLADHGAEVVKVEAPTGDPARRLPPLAHDDQKTDTSSLLFCVLNLNKRSITADLRTESGRELLLRLAERSDVIIEGFRPGVLDELGLGWNVLHRVNSRLILTSITPFGQTGPYARYSAEEIVLYALSGVMSYSGVAGREPLLHGGMQAQYEGGFNGAAATAVALVGRETSGEGQHVDISILQAVASTAIHAQGFYSFIGGVLGRRPPESTPINTIVPCKDGHVILQLPNETAWKPMVELLGRPELLRPPFDDPVERRRHGRELEAIVSDALKERTRAELFKQAGAMGVLVGIVQDPSDLYRCEHLDAVGFFRTIEQPGIGPLRIPAVLANFSLTPSSLRRPAPRLGEHNGEVDAEVRAASREDLVRATRGGVA